MLTFLKPLSFLYHQLFRKVYINQGIFNQEELQL